MLTIFGILLLQPTGANEVLENGEKKIVHQYSAASDQTHKHSAADNS